MPRLTFAALLLAAGLAVPALAHDGVVHASSGETAAHDVSAPAQPFPLKIEPRFALIDSAGRAVTEADFAGWPTARDTPDAMARKLPDYHPRLIGLTGSAAALAEARAVFQVEAKQVATAADGAPVFAHGSFIYLVGRDGEVKSLLPPILAPERMAELMRKYLL